MRNGRGGEYGARETPPCECLPWPSRCPHCKQLTVSVHTQVASIEAAEKDKMKQKVEAILAHGANCFTNRQVRAWVWGTVEWGPATAKCPWWASGEGAEQ